MVVNKIRQIRLARNFTQEYIALELGISQNAYSKIENGQVNMTVDRLGRVADILKVPVSELFAVTHEEPLKPATSSQDLLYTELKETIALLKDELAAKQQHIDGLLQVIHKLQEQACSSITRCLLLLGICDADLPLLFLL
ncbi:helix-turn-helix domain-containing protein [Chitinophaga pendula]|uniref:helix-turn-helix domain-containing protein n=1 Tax=Chitinophaga TaxID=79328 RepID=UPI0018E05CD7|nr:MULTISPECIES: helix-turn-helix transcriptional regulator [Chitinophaga]UCJ07924.1 helix-turn-helix domain-containing protein [Chitinophaga pendula]